MAGSLKWFQYTTDTGVDFGVFMDESNGEAVGNTDWTDSSAGLFKLPKNVTPRYARYVSEDGRRAANIIITDNDADVTTVPATIDFDVAGSATPVELTLTEFVGERIRLIPRADDTGLNDGDAT